MPGDHKPDHSRDNFTRCRSYPSSPAAFAVPPRDLVWPIRG